MTPGLDGVDHIHINVVDRAVSERWYAEVLGFSRVRELEFWAVDGGPLTLTDARGNIHLALFESDQIQGTTIAFRVSAAGLAQWMSHLAANGIEVEPVDHQISWSVYFEDIDGNRYEITTYEYTEFRNRA